MTIISARDLAMDRLVEAVSVLPAEAVAALAVVARLMRPPRAARAAEPLDVVRVWDPQDEELDDL